MLYYGDLHLFAFNATGSRVIDVSIRRNDLWVESRSTSTGPTHDSDFKYLSSELELVAREVLPRYHLLVIGELCGKTSDTKQVLDHIYKWLTDGTFCGANSGWYRVFEEDELATVILAPLYYGDSDPRTALIRFIETSELPGLIEQFKKDLLADGYKKKILGEHKSPPETKIAFAGGQLIIPERGEARYQLSQIDPKIFYTVHTLRKNHQGAITEMIVKLHEVFYRINADGKCKIIPAIMVLHECGFDV